MNEIQKILEVTFDFVKNLIAEYGEFYPLASAVKTDGNVTQIGTFDGDDNPLSNTLLENLKKALTAKQKDYNAVAIFYDVKVLDPNTNLKTDAIAILAEQKSEDFSFTLFYPYSISNNEIIFSQAWKTEKEREIFRRI